MTTEQSTIDKINDWATDKYTSASPSLTTATSTGTMEGSAADTSSTAPAGDSLLSAANTGSTTAGTSTTGSATGSASTTPVDINSWYRSTLGRDGDAAGVSFWQQALDSGRDAQSLYADFEKAAAANSENVKNGTTWDQANNYTGPQSTDKSTVVDDWGRNVLGRNLTASESAAWAAKMNAATTPAAANQVYQDFLAANAGSVKTPMDFASASQISTNKALTTQPYLLSASQLATRTIDPSTETVAGQINSLLAADSPVLQKARADGMRTGFERGMGNSSIAASAGEDALINAATGIATTDSGYYNNAANYNTAAQNQLLMYNADQQNEYNKLAMQYGDAEASRMMQLQIAQMNNDTTQAGQAQALQIANMQNSTTLAGQANQMSIAQLQDATTKLSLSTNTDKDTQSQKLSVANNIIANMDLSPDRKAAMLEQLGFGTSAKKNADGTVTAGTGLAGAVYVIDSTASDLTYSPTVNS